MAQVEAEEERTEIAHLIVILQVLQFLPPDRQFVDNEHGGVEARLQAHVDPRSVGCRRILRPGLGGSRLADEKSSRHYHRIHSLVYHPQHRHCWFIPSFPPVSSSPVFSPPTIRTCRSSHPGHNSPHGHRPSDGPAPVQTGRSRCSGSVHRPSRSPHRQ